MAVADHLNVNLRHKLSEDDVFITSGASQAIELMLTVLARPGANILLLRPLFPLYKERASLVGLEVRSFDLLPDRDWEVDLDGVESLADDKTIAMVIINPGYPTGNVFTLDHIHKIGETARRKGIIVIADEVYRHIVFGIQKFTPIGMYSACAYYRINVEKMAYTWLAPWLDCGFRFQWCPYSIGDH
ncbi:zinc-finger protein [Orobanche gracilis]